MAVYVSFSSPELFREQVFPTNNSSYIHCSKNQQRLLCFLFNQKLSLNHRVLRILRFSTLLLPFQPRRRFCPLSAYRNRRHREQSVYARVRRGSQSFLLIFQRLSRLHVYLNEKIRYTAVESAAHPRKILHDFFSLASVGRFSFHLSRNCNVQFVNRRVVLKYPVHTRVDFYQGNVSRKKGTSIKNAHHRSFITFFFMAQVTRFFSLSQIKRLNSKFLEWGR